ncbi:MAG: phage terminase large subunit [Blastocatellia bacterium]|nr:phage terminase large subunit [Blastocatellia bacterium]
MSNSTPDYERINTARDLFLAFNGEGLERIEREMRALGYHDFHRRILNDRFERGRHRPGWIGLYGWRQLLKAKLAAIEKVEEPRREEAEVVSDRCDATPAPQRLHYSAPQIDYTLDFDDFQDWLKQVSPGMTWNWKHQVYIYKRLRKLFDGDLKRLMIFLPPRHGKSELVTTRFAAYCLKKRPDTNIIIGSYNQRLANRFSRKIRKVLMDDHALGKVEESENRGVEEQRTSHEKRADRNSDCRSTTAPTPQLPDSSTSSVFPFISTKPKNTEAEWETTAGGGLRAVGVGAGVTGFGANMIIVDDPIRSRADAESETHRDKVYGWFNDDLYTRLEKDGSIVLVQTRWHEDDLAGRLLRDAQEEGGEQWEVIDLPALAEGMSYAFTRDDSVDPSQPEITPKGVTHTDPLGRAPGVALCPDRMDEAALGRIRRRLGSYSFAALYQQRPVPAEGGLFKRKWFDGKILSHAPPNLRWKRGIDTGITTGDNSDYTASFRVATDAWNNLYIDGGYRRRVEYPELRRYILGRIAAEPDTEIGIELSANGNAVYQDLMRSSGNLGRKLRGIRPKGDKVSRALGWLAMAEAGNVYLIRGPWNDEFLNEAASFPAGTHDDQIDAISIAVTMLQRRSSSFHAF